MEWPNPQITEITRVIGKLALTTERRETTSWLLEAKWPNQQSRGI